MNDWVTIFCGIGAGQSILFALLILVKKRRKLSDWVLMIWFLTFFVHLLLGTINKYHTDTFGGILIMTIGFLQGPLFLIYTSTLLKQRLPKLHLLHLIPFLFFTLFSFYIKDNQALSWEILILFTKLISLIAYPAFILYDSTKRLQLGVKERQQDLQWIKVIAILFLISVGISILRLSTELAVGVAYFEIIDVLRYITLVSVIGIFGLKFGVVFQPELSVESFSKESKYKNSPLKEEHINHLATTINRYFQENKAYLQSDFSLTSLSNDLNIPKHHLSQIINSEMNTTFYDLVNSKRINYAQKRIREGQGTSFTLEGLGYDCGFNSKSAFFHQFKKHTGKTPGQFKKEISSD